MCPGLPCRESEGAFAFGNYRDEADDVCDVVRWLRVGGRQVAAVVGHSKGQWGEEWVGERLAERKGGCTRWNVMVKSLLCS